MEAIGRVPTEQYTLSKTVMTLNKVQPIDSGRYQCKIKTTKGMLNRTFDIPPTRGRYRYDTCINFLKVAQSKEISVPKQ